jgi:anti-sigma regulatory factor (Ser/Thr protein kinase)
VHIAQHLSPGRLEQQVLADRGDVRRARHELAVWLRDRGVTDSLVGEIELVAGEAMTNAAEHAHAFDRSAFHAESVIVGEMLTLRIVDGGTWLSSDEERRAFASSGETLRGWGLAIIRQLADDVSVENDGTGTTLTVRKGLYVDVPPSPDDAPPSDRSET